MKQSIQLLHEILTGSSIHINLQIILEVHKKGGVEHDSWSGLLGGRDPCTHREAPRESGMLTTQGNLLNRGDKTQIHAFQPESWEPYQKAKNAFC